MGMTEHNTWGLQEPGFVLALDPGQSLGWEELVYDSSGGDQTIFFSDASGEQRELIFLRAIAPGDTETKEPLLEDPADALEEIRRVFGLNQSELAGACGLTRKALYDWQKGAMPRRKSAERLRQLHRAAMNWRRSGFPVPNRNQLHMPVIRDFSLLELLEAEPLDLEAIHFAGARMAMSESFEQEAGLADPFA